MAVGSFRTVGRGGGHDCSLAWPNLSSLGGDCLLDPHEPLLGGRIKQRDMNREKASTPVQGGTLNMSAFPLPARSLCLSIVLALVSQVYGSTLWHQEPKSTEPQHHGVATRPSMHLLGTHVPNPLCASPAGNNWQETDLCGSQLFPDGWWLRGHSYVSATGHLECRRAAVPKPSACAQHPE